MNLLGNFHALLTCDKPLADSAVRIVCESIPSIKVASTDVIRTKQIRETTMAYELRRGSERVALGIVVGDPASDAGPYDSEYWLVVTAEFSFFRRNNRLAEEIRDVLLGAGARE